MKFGTNSGIFLPFSAFFGHFLWESRDILSFSENIREILIKFHQNFAEKWPNSLTKVGMKWNFISFHFIPAKKFDGFLLEFWGVSGAKAKKSCRARKKWAYSRYRSCRYRRERAPQSLRCFISLFQSYPYSQSLAFSVWVNPLVLQMKRAKLSSTVIDRREIILASPLQVFWEFRSY